MTNATLNRKSKARTTCMRVEDEGSVPTGPRRGSLFCKLRRTMTLLAAALLIGGAWGEVTIKSVTAQQRYPWNGLVDIVVTLEGEATDVAGLKCAFTATDNVKKRVVPVKSVTQVGSDSIVGGVCTRRYLWDSTKDAGAVKIDDLALTVDAPGVQLWENGPYWAECNVGATKPEEYGYYFWWGDTVGYKRNASNNGWVSVKDGTSFSFSSSSCPTYGKSNSQLQSAGYIDSTGNLVAAHDAATAHLGAPWRMPTDAEFAALISNCTTTWITTNGVNGRLVTGKGAYASKSIFLPAAGDGNDSDLLSTGSYGDCWSSTPGSDYSDDAWYLLFNSGYFYRYYGSYRYCGLSVRPVRGFAK